MADFKTHLTVTSIFSSIASTVLLASSLAAPEEVLLCFILGVIGGLLPDIDSDGSLPVRLLFTFMATVIAFLVIFRQDGDDSVAELFLLWLASFAVIKSFVFSMFTRITIHRGMIHSIPFGALAGLLATILLHRVGRFGGFTVWMAGVFLFGGYILHLLLDELGSMGLPGRPARRSAGTALKFGNLSDLKTTTFVYVALTLTFLVVPDPGEFLSILTDPATYARLEILPEGGWFRELYANYIAGLK